MCISDPQYSESCNDVLGDNPIMCPAENLEANMNFNLITTNFSENNSSVSYTDGKESKLILGL